MRHPASLVALLLLAVPAVAQNLNTTRLARFDEHLAYNDIWGYTAPDGREYALLGETSGLDIVNVCDPLEPYEVAWFPHPFTCTWRDIKTWDRFVYEVNDCGPGVRVFDMLDPENPVQVGTFSEGVVVHTHNVQIDQQTGLLYLVGTNNRMRIFDLVADPIHPPEVANWNGPYVHDIYIQDGYAHAALIYDGDYRILDVSHLPSISTVSNTPSGADFAHSTWTTADGNTCVVADETSGIRHLSFYDITDKSAPVEVSHWAENPLSIPHNPFIVGDVCHVSWYTEGYIALDISDPANPVKLGRYDTQPGTDPGGINGFEGAWGCYPFAKSGFVYVSDRKRGLFVLALNKCSAELSPSPEPQVCDVWPAQVKSLTSPRQHMILTGLGFTNATQVTVGGVPLGPSDFEVMSDQTIAFRLPPLVALGENPIVVSNAAGTSGSVSVDVSLPDGVILDTGAETQVAGGTLLMSMASQPGDLHVGALAFTQAPSVIPNKVAYDIGNGFSDLVFLPTLVASPAGTSAVLLPVPATAVGVTVFWQFAYLDPQVGLPAAVSPVTQTTFVSEL